MAVDVILYWALLSYSFTKVSVIGMGGNGKTMKYLSGPPQTTVSPRHRFQHGQHRTESIHFDEPTKHETWQLTLALGNMRGLNMTPTLSRLINNSGSDSVPKVAEYCSILVGPPVFSK